MTNPYFGPVHDLIVDAAINAIDDLRSKGYVDHDSRQYFMNACGAAFDAHIAPRETAPESERPEFLG
jgi:hypothetical protein